MNAECTPCRESRETADLTNHMPMSNSLEDRLTDFAVSVLNVIESLPAGLSSTHIARRLVRSGTAPAPAYVEAACTDGVAEQGERLGTVLADLRESRVWLRILWKKAYLPGGLVVVLLRECEELIGLMASQRIALGLMCR